MRNRESQFDMAHAFATDFCQCYFDTAFFADNTTMFETFVFSAQTFVIFVGSENFRAEQTITFWFKGAIVDCFWLSYFTKRPRTNFFRRRQFNTQPVKFIYSSGFYLS